MVRLGGRFLLAPIFSFSFHRVRITGRACQACPARRVRNAWVSTFYSKRVGDSSYPLYLYSMKQLPFLLLVLLAACKGSQKPIATEQEIKTQEGRIRIMEVWPEPNLKKMPDSMKPWVSIFRKAWADDQRYRMHNNMDYLRQHGPEQKRLDSINLAIVDSFFTHYGQWPYQKWAGFLAHHATGMVIQHAPLAKQEHYYPIMKKAYQDGEVGGETLAMLQDRINMRNKRLQLYGTQFNYVNNEQVLYPVADFDSLNARRKRMNLVPIENYYAMFKLKWDSAAYKKRLPELEKALGVVGMPVE
jgi:hypothetical protein